MARVRFPVPPEGAPAPQPQSGVAAGPEPESPWQPGDSVFLPPRNQELYKSRGITHPKTITATRTLYDPVTEQLAASPGMEVAIARLPYLLTDQELRARWAARGRGSVEPPTAQSVPGHRLLEPDQYPDDSRYDAGWAGAGPEQHLDPASAPASGDEPEPRSAKKLGVKTRQARKGENR